MMGDFWTEPVTPAEMHQQLAATPCFIIEVLLLGLYVVFSLVGLCFSAKQNCLLKGCHTAPSKSRHDLGIS